jgi:hypothetical protein
VIELLALLLLAHFLLDYPLQGDFLSKAKNRVNPIPHVPWYQAMFAHTAMHGIAVGLITGIWILAVLEMAIHWITDDLKCRGELTFNQDQAIHIICKVVWAIIATLVIVL